MTYLENFTFFFLVVIFISCIIYYFVPNTWQLKCIISGEDGNTYCVRDRENIQEAADLLARIVNKCKKVIEYLNVHYKDDPKTIRLTKGFNPDAIYETLPTSSYTAYSVNKGERLYFCLNKKKNDEKSGLIDEDTLFFVALHEMSHIIDKKLNHTSNFWSSFKWLLEKAEESDLYQPKNYKENPVTYCGLKIHDNPFYDL
jgi:hypothetical protein